MEPVSQEVLDAFNADFKALADKHNVVIHVIPRIEDGKILSSITVYNKPEDDGEKITEGGEETN